jgi:hypothetical protein
VPEPGISMGFNIEPQYNGFRGATKSINGASINYYAKGTHEQRFFVLINPTIALEMIFFDSWVISLYAGKSWGLGEMSQLVVDYTIDNSPTYRGSILSHGNFSFIGIVFKYPISKKQE